jgi:hypothetical protein
MVSLFVVSRLVRSALMSLSSRVVCVASLASLPCRSSRILPRAKLRSSRWPELALSTSYLRGNSRGELVSENAVDGALSRLHGRERVEDGQPDL